MSPFIIATSYCGIFLSVYFYQVLLFFVFLRVYFTNAGVNSVYVASDKSISTLLLPLFNNRLDSLAFELRGKGAYSPMRFETTYIPGELRSNDR